MRVAACQLPEVLGNIDQSLSLICAYTLQAEKQGVDLICFPECFLQGYLLDKEWVNQLAIDFNSSEFRQILDRLSELKIAVVFGIIEKSNDLFFNTAVTIVADAKISQYRKANLLKSEKQIFQSGIETPIFSIEGVLLGIRICYDLNFSQTITATANAGAQLIVCPSNNMLNRETAEEWKEQHTVIRCKRAKEASVWLLSSDVTGHRDGCISFGPTSLISPLGDVIDQVPLMQTGMIVCDIG